MDDCLNPSKKKKNGEDIICPKSRVDIHLGLHVHLWHCTALPSPERREECLSLRGESERQGCLGNLSSLALTGPTQAVGM